MSGILWNPWHGCRKYSEGCKNCYVFYLDRLRDRDANIITKSKTSFNLPLRKTRQGEFKIPSGSELATCFTSDFFLEEADCWRQDAWDIIKRRLDVSFLICTKRVNRIMHCLPDNWGEGYPNVIFAVTCENQCAADERLPVFADVPVVKRYIFVSPILEYVDLKAYLQGGKFNQVSVGGESYENARLCDFEWVKRIYMDCKACGVKFDFHQTGSNFIKDGKRYKIKHCDEYSQAQSGMKYLEENF